MYKKGFECQTPIVNDYIKRHPFMKTKTTTWTCIWQWSAEINWDANKEMLTKYDFYDSWLERWKRALVTLGRWWFPLPKKNTLTSLSAAAVDWGNSGGHLQGLLAITSSTILTCLLSCVVILVTKTKYNTRSDVIAAPDKIGNCENSGISGSLNMRGLLKVSCLL